MERERSEDELEMSFCDVGGQWWEVLGANAERRGAYGAHVDPECRSSPGRGHAEDLTLMSARRPAFPTAPAP